MALWGREPRPELAPPPPAPRVRPGGRGRRSDRSRRRRRRSGGRGGRGVTQGCGRGGCRSPGRGRGRRRLLGCRSTGDQPGAGPLDRRGGVGSCRPVTAHGGRSRSVRRRQVRPRLGLGGRVRRDLLGGGLFGGGGLLGRWGRLFGLNGAAQALTVSLPAGAVSLRVLDGRGVALDAHPQGQAQVERLFVGQSELVSELVDADLLRQRLLLPFLTCRRCRYAHTTLYPRTSQDRTFRAHPGRHV